MCIKGLIRLSKIIKDICNRIAIILEIIKDINLFEKILKMKNARLRLELLRHAFECPIRSLAL